MNIFTNDDHKMNYTQFAVKAEAIELAFRILCGLAEYHPQLIPTYPRTLRVCAFCNQTDYADTFTHSDDCVVELAKQLQEMMVKQ